MNESSSPSRDLQVFDFKVEDDDDKHLSKFSKISTPDTFAHVYRSRRNKNDTGLATHQLQAKVKQGNVLQDAQINEVGVKNIPSIPCVDVDVAGSILDSETGCSNPSFETMEDTIDSKVKNSESGADNQSNSISQENHCHSKLNVDYYDRPENRDTTGGASTPETSQIGPSGFPSSVHSSPNIFPDAQINEVGVKNVPSIPCVDVDVVGSILNSETGCSNPSFETMEDTFDSKVKNSELGADTQSNSVGQENHYQFKLNVDYYDQPENRDTTGGASTPETSQIGPSGSPSSKESVDVSSDADDCMNYESAPISAASDIAENVSLNGCGFDGAHISDASDADETNTEVVLRPDYIIYQDNYYMGPMLTFSHSCIKINVSTACMKQEAFDLEWGLDDLINIKCQLVQSSGTVIIKINVISRNANQLDHVSDTSGIEELKIAVVDSNWSLIQEEITSLNVKYLAIWNIMLNMDVEDYETKSGGSRCYFPNFEEPFDEVIYPKGDPDAVSLSKRDFDLLQPDTFINDTIIDFYIQYLKNQIQEEEKPRFHFFNSFFFRKLADLDKNPSSALDGKAAFLRVRKWTRKVNLFEKDYIFIPVNFNLHWSLIVICHPGEVISLNDKELDHALKVPCILHMDSIKGNHSGLKNLLQSYLWEEWKERHKDALDEDVSALFSNLRFLPLVLPQQENSYDCGLFLLHYLELFLAEAPFTFNPFKVTKFSNFLNVDWFLPAEAYLKRTLIQRLISELVENHGSREIPSADGSDDHQYIESIENGIGIEHPEVNRVSKTLHAGQGIEMTLLSGSSALDPQSFNNSGMVLKDLFEPGTTSGTMAQCQSFDQRSSDYRFNSSIFSMEEDSVLGEFMYTNFQQVAGVTPQEDSNFGEQFMYLATDTNFQQVAGVTPQEDSNFGEQFTYLATDTNFQQVAGVTPQEDSDLGEQFMYMATDTNFQQVARVTPQACSLPYLPRDCGNGTNHIPDFSLQEALSSPSGTSDDTEEIGITEYCPDDGNEPIASNEADQGERICSLIGNTEHFIDISASAGNNLPTLPVVGISDDSIMNCDGYKNEDIHSPCQETPTLTLCQVSDAVDDEAACDDGQMVDGTEPDISEEQAAKRRRVMPLECRSEGIVTESNL